MTFLLTLLERLLTMSLTAGFVAVIVLLLRLVLKKRAPKQVICLLWLVVFARLLVPVAVEAPFSLVPSGLDAFVAEQMEGTAEVPDEPAAAPEPPSHPIQAPVVQAPEVQGPAVQDPAAVPTQPVSTAPVSGGPQPAVTVPPVVEQPPAEDVPAAEEPSGEPAVTGWLYALPILWLMGVAGMLAYGTASYLMLRRRVYDAVCGEDGVWEHHALRSPFILGLFRPGIYLPMGITGQARQFILQHERAHLRRWDHVVKPVCWAALAVHWFNPFAWAAFLLMSRDIETACDESVIRRLGEEVKADYSDTLLELAVSKRFPSPSPLSFGEGDAKTRIKHVLNFKKPAQWVSVVAAVVAVAAALCLLTDRGDSYTRYEAYPEGLGFRVEADERTGVTTTRAYRLDGREPVLVGGWVYYPANNFTGLIHPDGTEEPLLGGPWNVRAQYGQMVVDAARELDPEWADSLLELKWDEKEGLQPHSAMSHPSGETYFMSFLTQENDLLIYLNGDLFVFPLTTFSVPEGVGAVLQDIDGDGVEELTFSYIPADGYEHLAVHEREGDGWSGAACFVAADTTLAASGLKREDLPEFEGQALPEDMADEQIFLTDGRFIEEKGSYSVEYHLSDGDGEPIYPYTVRLPLAYYPGEGIEYLAQADLDMSQYTRMAGYPRLYFLVGEDPALGETVTAYKLAGNEMVLVGGFIEYPDNDFSAIIGPDNMEERVAADAGEVYAIFEEMLADASRLMDQDWTPADHASAFTELYNNYGYGLYLTQRGSVMIVEEHDVQVIANPMPAEGGMFGDLAQFEFSFDPWDHAIYGTAWTETGITIYEALAVFKKTGGTWYGYGLDPMVSTGPAGTLQVELFAQQYLDNAEVVLDRAAMTAAVTVPGLMYPTATLPVGENAFTASALDLALDGPVTFFACEGRFYLRLSGAVRTDERMSAYPGRESCAGFDLVCKVDLTAGEAIVNPIAIHGADTGFYIPPELKSVVNVEIFEDELDLIYFNAELGVGIYISSVDGSTVLRYGAYIQRIEGYPYNALRATPGIWEGDVDGDGVKELYISHTWASGTGVAVDRLLVCEPNGGELNYWIHDWEPLTGDFNANRAASYDEETGHVTVTYKGVTITANPGLLLPADIYDNPAAITGEQVRYTRGKDGNIDLCFTLGLTGRQAAPHFYGMYVVSSLRFNGNGFTVVVDPYLTSVGYGDLIDFLPGEGVYLYEDAGDLILQDGGTIGPVAYVNDINDSHPGYFDLSAVTITRREMRNDWEGGPLYVTIMLQLPASSGGVYPDLWWVEEEQCWDLAPAPGPLADLPGAGELVTPSTLPSDPKEFYLVGRLGTIALYARDHGEQTLLVQEGSFWQLYDHRAHTSHLNLPKLTMLRDHYLAVVSEVGTGTQTGVDQLVVYDMNWDEPDENGMIIQLFESYTYDWRTIAAQFNRNNTLVYDKETNSFTVTYGGRTYNTGTLSTDMSRTLDLEDGFTGAAIASGQVVRYQFNEDDTITIAMQTCVGGGGDGYFSDDLMDIWKWNGEENYYNGMTVGVNGIELTWTIDFYHGQFHVDPFSIGLKV